jgi:protein-tyrosine phosphatase
MTREPIVAGVTSTDSDQFRLSGAWNFRDLGGLQTKDGRTVQPGIIFRSSQLAELDNDGQIALLQLGITDVFDFRGDTEISHGGRDNLPDGVRLHEAPFHERRIDDETAPHEAPRLDSPDGARDFLSRAYAEFPLLKGAHAAIADVLETVADTDSKVLIHCAAGKDRAGWVAATLLRAIGVAEDDIIADYLRSNDAIATLRSRMSAQYGQALDLSDEVLGVDEEYYRVAMQTVVDHYGTFEQYLGALGLESGAVSRLRGRLLD